MPLISTTVEILHECLRLTCSSTSAENRTDLNDIPQLHAGLEQLLQEGALASADIALHAECDLVSPPLRFFWVVWWGLKLGQVLHDVCAVPLISDANLPLHDQAGAS